MTNWISSNESLHNWYNRQIFHLITWGPCHCYVLHPFVFFKYLLPWCLVFFSFIDPKTRKVVQRKYRSNMVSIVLLCVCHVCGWWVGSTCIAISVVLLDGEMTHDDGMTWKSFPHHWPFVTGIHLWLGNPPHKVMWTFHEFCEQTIELVVIWDATALMSPHCNERQPFDGLPPRGLPAF